MQLKRVTKLINIQEMHQKSFFIFKELLFNRQRQQSAHQWQCTNILWQVASCVNILTNTIYFSSHLRQQSGDAMHSEEYLDNISGDCHHGAEAETRGGSAGNLQPTLPAAGTCHFVTNHKTSFVILYYLLSMQKKHTRWHKENCRHCPCYIITT